MPTDLTGTPTSLGIGTFNVDADAPSGLGFNEAMTQIDALIASRIGTPAGITTGEIPVWNGSTWVRSLTQRPGQSSLGTGTPGILTFLRGDGAWAEGGLNVLWDSTDAGVVFPTNGITTSTLPTNFKNLLVSYEARASDANFLEDLQVQIGINGGAIDGGTNYNTMRFFNTTGSNVTGADNISLPDWIAGAVAGASGDNSTMSSGFIFFPGYSNTGQANNGRHNFVGISVVQGGNSGATGAMRLTVHSGIYKNTVGAITALKFTAANANMVSGTRFTVYGLG